MATRDFNPASEEDTMSRTRVAILLAGAALTGPAVRAQGLYEASANLVTVSVQVDGRAASLYPSPDGSGRYYLEARTGSRYAVALANRSAERVGVVLTVDGLNAISGARDTARGRMYVLDPWQSTSVQGWRTSLQDVRQFTFVDERRSYATRTGQANEKMGWIEVAVYRERRPYVQATPLPYPEPRPYPTEEQEGRARAQAPASPESSRSADNRDAAGAAKLEGGARDRSYPGTGWGEHAHDPVVLVSFDPESEPSGRATLRYEYRPALIALGVLPPYVIPRDRLWQRERGEPGFAQPPRW
jgi:hypothetical protein